jgi:hypothetical protein
MKVKLYERTRYKTIKYSNHLNFLNECKNKKIVTNFIKIKKHFDSHRANRIIEKSEMLILRITESRRELFILKDKVTKLQCELFEILEHDKFQ